MMNVKYVLITLVITANMLEPVISRHAGAMAVYETIYTFHIPMFAFAMGYSAQDYRQEGRASKALTAIAYQYIVFQSLYSLADASLFHAPGVVYSFFMPYSLLWFLCSHFCWRLLLPLFSRMKYALPTAVLLGVAAGYIPWEGGWVSLSRTFVFFPFFLAGFKARNFPRWQAAALRIRPFAVAAGFAVLAVFWLGPHIDPGWLYGSRTFAELGSTQWYAGLQRLGIYVLEAAASICFLACVPWSEGRLTGPGKRTLYVFLLQGFVIKAMLAAGLYDVIENERMAVPLLVAAAVLLALGLSRPQIERAGKRWIEPDFPALIAKLRTRFRTRTSV
ncbi:hypothetical protein VN24_13415 [Paenibacillus beijingensis]|uniref:Fucose 4-O-acetylase n=2 Tax=Paenibacillus beijingensis TaxID=1126833 RepID=A0A0D5NR26_9BACL|nr:hypothetical protein VN24_13415 [Paenibacillus beijingensis]